MTGAVRIVEVGPRDGLQNEKTLVPAAAKIELIDRLSATGLRSVEATSFVSPRWVPQLADAAEVYVGIAKRPGVRYPVLVPNEQGYERARAVGVDEIAVFTAASDAFNRKNINAGIEESLQRFAPVIARAQADGVAVRGYVSTVLGCPYAKGASGNVATEDVVYMLQGMGFDTGIDLDALGDTGRWLSRLLGRETGSKVTRARSGEA
jgi:hydroxymethylglutaryl-CoA lyase